jgi:hypothetical protein
MKDDFDHYFRDACNALQKEKFQMLKRSKIFKGWSVDAIVRLCRMARMKTVPRCKEILKQGKPVDSMYGMCKRAKQGSRGAAKRAERAEEKEIVGQRERRERGRGGWTGTRGGAKRARKRCPLLRPDWREGGSEASAEEVPPFAAGLS